MADDNTVYRAIKYRVYPTDAQSEKLSQTFGCARKVYNDALSMQRGLYEAGMPTFGQTALNAYCNRVWKDEYPFLTEVDKFALTNSLYALCAAYKNFFEGALGILGTNRDVRKNNPTQRTIPMGTSKSSPGKATEDLLRFRKSVRSLHLSIVYRRKTGY